MWKFGVVFVLVLCLMGAAKADVTVLFAAGGHSPGYWDDPDNWPWDIGGIDDTELLYLDITEQYASSRVISPPGTSGTNPHASPHQYPCPDLPVTVQRTVTGTYTESWSESVSTTISSKIGAELDGIQSEVGTSITSGASYTESAATSYSLAITEGPLDVPAGASWDWSYTEYYVHFSGTGRYFDDKIWNDVRDFTWTVEATYDLASNGIKVTGGSPCPVSLVPAPGSIFLLALGGMCISAKRACSRFRRRS